MSRIVVLALIAFATQVSPAAAQNKAKRPPPACGYRYLPLSQGTVLEYTQLVGTGARREQDPPLPDKVTITVAKIEPWQKDGKPVAGGSRIELTETFRKVTRQTEVFCSASGIVVDPQSFLFTGEAGGGLNMDLSEIKRSEEPTWPAKESMKTGTAWREDVSATVTRHPADGTKLKAVAPARIEIEREAKVDGVETLTINGVEYKNAARVVVALTGRSSGSGKDVSIPDAETTYWFANDVGLVRVENRYLQQWQLNTVTLPGDAVPAPTTPATPPAPAKP